jgi:HlyD family secretion protein
MPLRQTGLKVKVNMQAKQDITKIIAIEETNGNKRWLKKPWFWWLLAAIVVSLILIIRSRMAQHALVHYQTEKVRRGDLVVTVSATGTLSPVNEVEVGIEVSGTIEKVFADYNDRVKVGQVLANLDTRRLEAQAGQSKSALEATRAKVLQAEATLKETQLKMSRYDQTRQLSGGKVPSPLEMDTARANLTRAKADLANAKASVLQAENTYKDNQIQLKKAVVYSPINGVVLERSIEPGQTVASSFESPVLFKLAEDLTKMELQVDVDEADVGLVSEGQEGTFTVDAYPDQTFPAKITQVRYGSETVDGVVTYKTVLAVDNFSIETGCTSGPVDPRIDDVTIMSGTDSPYLISPQSTKVGEGDSSITFTITRLDTTVAETLYVSTVALVNNDGDYSGMDDQPILNKPISFAVGQKSSTVQVKIINDDVIESNETFSLIVQRSSSDEKSVFLASAMFTILDDDGLTLQEVKNKAIQAAIGLIGAPYLGDAFTYSGKGYDCEINKYTEATEIKDKNVGYNYYDNRIKGCSTAKDAGVDCSGLVMWSFNSSYAPNPKLSIISNESAASIKEFNTEPVPDGSPKQQGDLMFFLYEGSVKHVAMYVGDFLYKGKTYDVVESTLTEGVIPSKSSDLKVKPTFVGFGRLTEPKVKVAIRTASPIDLIVTDPDGFTITPDTIEWTGEEWIHEIPHQLYYSIYDFEEDGSPKTQVYSPRFKLGDYEIRPVKRKDAPANAVYSISMTTDAGAMLIAEDVPVDNIPPTGYGVTVKETGLTPFVPINQLPTANAGADQTVECTGLAGTSVALNGSGSSDPDKDPLTYTWTGSFGTVNGATPTVTLPMGANTITLTVSDGKGGTASDTVIVKVVDTTPPVIQSVAAKPSALWPPNHKMVPATVTVSAKDLCSATTTCKIVAVKSNEPINGTGDGDTAPDWQITGNLTVNLRAERAGSGSGRIYTITVQCTDASGNSSTKDVAVTVPHDQG